MAVVGETSSHRRHAEKDGCRSRATFTLPFVASTGLLPSEDLGKGGERKGRGRVEPPRHPLLILPRAAATATLLLRRLSPQTLISSTLTKSRRPMRGDWSFRYRPSFSLLSNDARHHQSGALPTTPPASCEEKEGWEGIEQEGTSVEHPPPPLLPIVRCCRPTSS